MCLMGTMLCSCNNSNTGEHEFTTDPPFVSTDGYIPQAPDYADSTMWHTENTTLHNDGADVFYIVSTWEKDWTTTSGRVCHYADVWSKKHRDRMNIEITKAAQYMAPVGRFYAPYYRHTTIETWATLNEDTITARTALSMNDVKQAFDYFLKHRDNSRPIILAGFSQGGKAVVELLKHMSDETAQKLVAAYVMGYKVTPTDTLQCPRIKAAHDSIDTGVTICYNTVKDVSFIKPVVSVPCAMCINPVNWRTDSVSARLHDSISVTVSPNHHVLVVKGYNGDEYKPILNILNTGDIHGCEPWLYSGCIAHNMKLRTQVWRKKYNNW